MGLTKLPKCLGLQCKKRKEKKTQVLFWWCSYFTWWKCKIVSRVASSQNCALPPLDTNFRGLPQSCLKDFAGKILWRIHSAWFCARHNWLHMMGTWSQNSVSTPHSWWARGVCTCTLRPASLLLLSCCKVWSLDCHIITHNVMTSHLGFPRAPQNIPLKMIILCHMMVILSI